MELGKLHQTSNCEENAL